LAFFSRFSVIASASAGTPPTLKSQAPVNHALPAVLTGATLYEVRLAHLLPSLRFTLLSCGHIRQSRNEPSSRLEGIREVQIR